MTCGRAARAPGSGRGSAARRCRSCQISFSRAVSRSASRRELANTRVERWAGDEVDDALLDVRPDRRPATGRRRPVRSGSARPPGRAARSSRRPSASSSAMSGTGTTTSQVERPWPTAVARSVTGSRRRRRASGRPPRPGGPSPTARPAGPAARAARRAARGESARCAPRLVPASGVHLVDDDGLDAGQRLAGREVSSRNSDSGVVIRTSGGVRANGRRSSAGVSPERTATRDVGRRQAEPGRRLPDAGQRGCAGCARRRPRAPSAARRRAPGTAGAAAPPGAASRRAGRAPRGTPPASCPTRWARRPACAPRGRSRVPGAGLGRRRRGEGRPNQARVAGEKRAEHVAGRPVRLDGEPSFAMAELSLAPPTDDSAAPAAGSPPDRVRCSRGAAERVLGPGGRRVRPGPGTHAGPRPRDRRPRTPHRRAGAGGRRGPRDVWLALAEDLDVPEERWWGRHEPARAAAVAAETARWTFERRIRSSLSVPARKVEVVTDQGMGAQPWPRPPAAPMPSSTPRSLIEARGLTKRFGDFTAVDGIDVDVHRGEAFGFLGPNGAGKSSTMRMIGCVSPPSGGDAARSSGSTRDADGPGIRARLGVVPQEDTLDASSPSARTSSSTAATSASRGPTAASGRRAARVRPARPSGPTAKVEPLSGGMKRRLTIARSLVNDPEILLLDEPTTGLDPQARHVVWDRLFRLKQQGVTLVLTTHYMDEAEQLCDRLVVMDGGRIVAEGSPAVADRAVLHPRGARAALRARTSHDGLRRPLVDGLGERVEVLPDRMLVYTDDGDAAAEARRTREASCPAVPAGPALHAGGRLPAAHRPHAGGLSGARMSGTETPRSARARTSRPRSRPPGSASCLGTCAPARSPASLRLLAHGLPSHLARERHLELPRAAALPRRPGLRSGDPGQLLAAASAACPTSSSSLRGSSPRPPCRRPRARRAIR